MIAVGARSGLFAALLASLVAAVPVRAQVGTPVSPGSYPELMNRIAQPQLARRTDAIAKIHTRARAKERQALVRATMLRLIGGLPENAGPLNATVVGTIEEEGFRIERVIYDSLPGYHVTANLYLPARAPRPAPAVIYHAGHGPFGKSEAFGLASNLARNGIAVLAYDPLGAGERLQAMDPSTDKSYAGADEHSQAEIPISLIGGHVARYMVWDAMRGIDYLVTRPEIDAKNIGSYGCSGGGTMSAYLMALDPRVKAGAVACYLTTYDELLKTIGPQDGEQVIPGSIKNGLDFPDLVELAAPRAYAMISTTEDMFPFAGAKSAHDEAKRFYSLYGAEDQLQWLTGPGRHGAIRPLMPDIIAFFKRSLGLGDGPLPTMVTLKAPTAAELRCTTTGQVTTGLTGRTIFQINLEKAQRVLPRKKEISSTRELKTLQARLKTEIPAVTGMGATTGPLSEVTVVKTEARQGYRLESITFHSRSGMSLPGLVALPDTTGRHPALLMTSAKPIDGLGAPGGELDRAALAGTVVLAMTPLPWPLGTDQDKPTLGALLPWSSRALLVGKTFVGMRVEDMLAAMQWLAAQREVDPEQIDGYGEGVSGVVLLHAAVLEPKIRRITIEHSLASYHSVLEASVHRGVVESVVPDVLHHYDLDELMEAAGPRPITVVNPVDGEGKPLTEAQFTRQFTAVEVTDRALGWGSRLRFVTR